MDLPSAAVGNQLDELVEQSQSGPVFVAKAGSHGSVLISRRRYEELLIAERGESMEERRAKFNEQYKDWIDEQNRLVETYGVFGAEHRPW